MSPVINSLKVGDIHTYMPDVYTEETRHVPGLKLTLKL